MCLNQARCLNRQVTSRRTRQRGQLRRRDGTGFAACSALPVDAGAAGGRRGAAVPMGRGGGFLCPRRLPGSSSERTPRETGWASAAAKGRGRKGQELRRFRAAPAGAWLPCPPSGRRSPPLLFLLAPSLARGPAFPPRPALLEGKLIKKKKKQNKTEKQKNPACLIYLRLVHRPTREGEKRVCLRGGARRKMSVSFINLMVIAKRLSFCQLHLIKTEYLYVALTKSVKLHLRLY